MQVPPVPGPAFRRTPGNRPAGRADVSPWTHGLMTNEPTPEELGEELDTAAPAVDVDAEEWPDGHDDEGPEEGPEPREDLGATYAPEDNKLRLYNYGAERLDKPTYDRIWQAGFRWAPKQKLFVAPSWTPARLRLLVELCGSVEPEDQTLEERAAFRAERFAGYRANRQRDGDAAHAGAVAISERFAGGQPIIVGHHSERRARRDHDRMDRGFRKALDQWETAAYWRERAAATKAHASYKADPGVRHRRIRGLEKDRRRFVASYTPDPKQPAKEWDGVRHVWIPGAGGGRGGHWMKESALPAQRAHAEVWIRHIDMRLEYERAMLEESGGLAVTRADIPLQVGGRIRCGAKWYPIVRLNRETGGGPVVSVSTRARGGIVGVEAIDEVKAPEVGDAEKVRAAVRKPTLYNYPGEGFTHYTKAQWARIWDDSRGSEVIPAGQYVEHRVRREWRYRAGMPSHLHVFVTDMPVRYPPAAPIVDVPAERPALPAPVVDDAAARALQAEAEARRAAHAADDQESGRIAELRAAVDGVKPIEVVHAPQLFPTPAKLAWRLVELADVRPGHRVLEPEAGTMRIVHAIFDSFTGADCGHVTAVEINERLCELMEEDRRLRLFANESNYRIVCGDFLAQTPAMLGTFHRIVMNPPFAGGADIKHVIHAIPFLKPGGIIAGICAGGPRQDEKLRPMVEQCGGTWERLPAGTFPEAPGTNTVLFAFTPEW